MPTVGGSFEMLFRDGPRLFAGATSMLYVGHRSDTNDWWHKKFAPEIGITRLAVIDILNANMQSAIGITSELYTGDIRNPESVPYSFDLVFWDEGPEHVAKEEALETLRMLKTKHRYVLISCPWGYQSQGSGPADPEFHHWGPQPEDFESIGMNTATFGRMFLDNAGHGNLIAWYGADSASSI